MGITLKNKRCKRRVSKAFCNIHLPAPHYNEIPDECPICSENIIPENSLLSCGHYVHWDCLIQWDQGYRCPICRASLPEFSQLKPSPILESDDSDDDSDISITFSDILDSPRIILNLNIPESDLSPIIRLLYNYYEDDSELL